MIHIIYFTIFTDIGGVIIRYFPVIFLCSINPLDGDIIHPSATYNLTKCSSKCSSSHYKCLKKYIFLKILFHLKKRLKSWNNRTCIALYCIDFHRSPPEVCGCLETTKVNEGCALDHKKHNTSSSAHLMMSKRDPYPSPKFENGFTLSGFRPLPVSVTLWTRNLPRARHQTWRILNCCMFGMFKMLQ